MNGKLLGRGFKSSTKSEVIGKSINVQVDRERVSHKYIKS